MIDSSSHFNAAKATLLLRLFQRRTGTSLAKTKPPGSQCKAHFTAFCPNCVVLLYLRSSLSELLEVDPWRCSPKTKSPHETTFDISFVRPKNQWKNTTWATIRPIGGSLSVKQIDQNWWCCFSGNIDLWLDITTHVAKLARKFAITFPGSWDQKLIYHQVALQCISELFNIIFWIPRQKPVTKPQLGFA